MLPPSDVYLAALCSTLLKIWLKREKSPNTQTGVSGTWTDNAWRFESMSGRTISSAVLDDLAELDGLAVQRDLALRDARHVEQIVDEAGEVRDLPLDDLAHPGDARVVRRHLVEHLRGRDDRRERIAQLVRQHREELVLAPVRFLELLLGRLARAPSRAPGCCRAAHCRTRWRRAWRSRASRGCRARRTRDRPCRAPARRCCARRP